jgi:hypothetical protein
MMRYVEERGTTAVGVYSAVDDDNRIFAHPLLCSGLY